MKAQMIPDAGTKCQSRLLLSQDDSLIKVTVLYCEMPVNQFHDIHSCTIDNILITWMK